MITSHFIFRRRSLTLGWEEELSIRVQFAKLSVWLRMPEEGGFAAPSAPQIFHPAPIQKMTNCRLLCCLLIVAVVKAGMMERVLQCARFRFRSSSAVLSLSPRVHLAESRRDKSLSRRPSRYSGGAAAVSAKMLKESLSLLCTRPPGARLAGKICTIPWKR